MKTQHFMKAAAALILILLFISPVAADTPQWYQDYEMGLTHMARGDYQTAAQYFYASVTAKGSDQKKTRLQGTIFIEYYGNRELGICYYHLGDIDKAREYLAASMKAVQTDRARSYLKKISGGDVPKEKQEITLERPPLQSAPLPAVNSGSPAAESSTEMVGERMSIAVLPFDSQGLSGEIGGIDLVDKLITGLVNSGRFKVIERAQLEKILAEQKLGLTGIIDASTAAEIGKGIGVDAVVLGSVTRANNAVSVDARIIDTETAAIIAAKDAYTDRINLQSLSSMILDLGQKFRTELPIVHGYVINLSEAKVTLDIGRNNGILKGMKCTVYNEGEKIIHPVSGKVIGKMINEICIVQITDVFDAYSLAEIKQVKRGSPQKLDKVITK